MLARMMRPGLFCALLFLAAPAQAQESAPIRAVMQATAYAALPAGAALAVRPPDSSQESADMALLLT